MDASVERSYVGVDLPLDVVIVDLVRSNQSNLLDEQIIVLDLSSCPIDLGLNERRRVQW